MVATVRPPTPQHRISPAEHHRLPSHQTPMQTQHDRHCCYRPSHHLQHPARHHRPGRPRQQTLRYPTQSATSQSADKQNSTTETEAIEMATPSRFELPISSLTGRRVRPLHHGAAKANSRHRTRPGPRPQAAARVKDNAERRPRQGVMWVRGDSCKNPTRAPCVTPMRGHVRKPITSD